MRAATILAAALALAACGKGSAPSDRDGVTAAWTKAGLTVSAMSAAAPIAGGDCRAGTVSGVDVTLCSFKDDKAAAAAQDAGLAAIGTVTGAAIAHGSMLVVVADPRKADPSGRTIDQVTKIFRGR